MFFALCGLLIGIIVFINTKKEDFIFGLIQVAFFTSLGFCISIILSYSNIVPTTKTLVETINLEELSTNTYLDLKRTTDEDNFFKSYELTFINSGKKETRTNLKDIKINVNTPDDGSPYINVYKNKFDKEFYKYFFFEENKEYYELNINPNTYKSLKI